MFISEVFISQLFSQVFFQGFGEIMIYLFNFPYFLGTPISRKISYLVVDSKSIVSKILIIKKTKKIFSFSHKHVAKNSKLLSENLKAKSKLKILKARRAMKNFRNFYFFYFLIFYSFNYLFIYFWLKKSRIP